MPENEPTLRIVTLIDELDPLAKVRERSVAEAKKRDALVALFSKPANCRPDEFEQKEEVRK